MALQSGQFGVDESKAMGGNMTTMTPEVVLGIRKGNGTGEQIRKGLPYKSLLQFREQIGISTKEMSDIFDMPTRTILRRKEVGKLNKEESNALFRAARVFAETVEYFEGDTAAARNWMRDKVPALGYRRPIDMLDTDADAQAVIKTLARLSEGIVT
jgi:putative toxin-antitoxin system antitoxin component (TIGR02293 family)